jgi:hypothetical protein
MARMDETPVIDDEQLDEQHPRTADGRWMVHCVRCGEYVDDSNFEPPLDFLCDDCEADPSER